LIPGDALKAADHYAGLDGLRGIAALSVVLHHLGHWLNEPGLASNGGLAVDFFFCLSGFVLSYAYDKRLQANLSASGFLTFRLIRLMPLIVLATLISAVYVLCRSMTTGSSLPYYELLVAAGLGIINIPFLTASSTIGGPQVFPLNGPQYSLFLEIVVNALWAALRRFDKLYTSGFVVLICLFSLALFGLGGDDAKTFWTGFPRVGASFFLGVGVFHLNEKLKRRAGFEPLFWALTALMLLLFYYPRELPLAFHIVWLALLSPLLVLAGANVRLSGRLRTTALAAGNLSYPIYALHYPIFCWINGAYRTGMGHPDVIVEAPIIVAFVLIGSHFAVKAFDEPVRRWAEHLVVHGRVPMASQTTASSH
jgi:peptidoglycan/LPS O-acetylase OafA/YrhL